jgi:hypothetical protein
MESGVSVAIDRMAPVPSVDVGRLLDAAGLILGQPSECSGSVFSGGMCVGVSAIGSGRIMLEWTRMRSMSGFST